LVEAKSQDPFWYFEPSDGSITEEGKALLHKYLKEDDIPTVLDGQVDAFKSVSSIKGVCGGNQSGKSVFGAIDGYIWMTGEVPFSLEGVYPMDTLRDDRNRNIRVVGVSNKQLLNTVLPTWQEWVPKKYLKNGKWKDSFSAEQKKLHLYVPGFKDKLLATCEFMTNEQDVDSFQGPPLGKIIYDEEPKEAIYKENLMRFTTASQLNILFCFTPTHGLSWATDLLFNEETDKSVSLIKLVSVTNKKANLAVLDEILSEIVVYDELKMRLCGSAVSLSGLVYGSLFSKIHVIEPFPITRTAHIVYRGLDPHLVKPSVCVEVATDRMENYYVIGTYSKDADTSEIKKDLKERAMGYRLGQTRCDKSADSTIRVLGDRNVFRELSTGENAIPAMFKSEKFTGSIHAGVDTIKQLLKINEKTGKPRLFIFNIPENKTLINAMKTLERDTYANEDDKGKKDTIKEGKHDTHAALRYVFQSRVPWLPPVEAVPEYQPVNEAIGY
jgi:phage terminase large subunit-like protein